MNEKKEKDHGQELEELKEKYYRALADMDNMRKRTAIEKEETISFANEALILEILPIMDSFERAMDSFKDPEGPGEILKGTALIKKQLEDVLFKCGLSPIEALGKPFDPNFHEAVMKKASDEHAPGTVSEVLQKGYMLHEKVIRPAMVVVSD